MTPFEKHFIQVGVIGRPKGTKGLLRFHSYLNDDRDVNQFKKFYLDNEKTINLKLVSFDKKSPLITIDEKNNRTDIEKFVNKKIFLKKEQLSPVKGNEYYFHDLEGLEVFDNKDQRVGEVASVVNFGAGDLLEIYFIKSKKKEFFRFTEQNFPFVKINVKIQYPYFISRSFSWNFTTWLVRQSSVKKSFRNQYYQHKRLQ